MKVQITTLVENTVGIGGSRELIGEHGLAFLIEAAGRCILFDTGQYVALDNNARVLGRDLAAVDAVVLSHGHYDHTGGLKDLLKANSNFTLYAHPDIFTHKFIRQKGRCRDIGIPVSKDDLITQGVKIKLDTASVEITPGIITTGQIPQTSAFESIAEGFFVEKGGRKVPDALADDQALILKTGKGTVVVLGCSHRGVINTLEHVNNITGEKRIHAVLGGLHLVKTSGDNLGTIIDHLQEFEIEKIVVGHCTGTHAIHALYARFGDKVLLNTVGNTMTF
jgi:7,8-dihydropterin-6-yl-methyl-4-(beta-D-ribofuranosyl)aminobenzene 5'-phosphate synthase